MFGKVALIEFALMVAMIIGGIFYFRYTEGVIATLNQNVATLTEAVDTEKATIQAQIDAAKKQDASLQSLQQSVNAAASERSAFEIKLRNQHLADLAKLSSQQLEQKINTDTTAQFNELITLTTPAGSVTQPNLLPIPTTSLPQPLPVQIKTAPTTPIKTPIAMPAQHSSNYQPPPHPPVPN